MNIGCFVIVSSDDISAAYASMGHNFFGTRCRVDCRMGCGMDTVVSFVNWVKFSGGDVVLAFSLFDISAPGSSSLLLEVVVSTISVS